MRIKDIEHADIFLMQVTAPFNMLQPYSTISSPYSVRVGPNAVIVECHQGALSSIFISACCGHVLEVVKKIAELTIGVYNAYELPFLRRGIM
jgi:hypothetical protein